MFRVRLGCVGSFCGVPGAVSAAGITDKQKEIAFLEICIWFYCVYTFYVSSSIVIVLFLSSAFSFLHQIVP